MTTPNNLHVEILAEARKRPIEFIKAWQSSSTHTITVDEALTALATLQGECDAEIEKLKNELEWYKLTLGEIRFVNDLATARDLAYKILKALKHEPLHNCTRNFKDERLHT